VTSFSSKTGAWEGLKEYCQPIRLAVFVAEQGVPSSLELDGLDERCHHVVIFTDDHEPIATARLDSDGKFGRMAVLKTYRQHGIGNELLKLIEQKAKALKLEQLYCHAQLSAAGFYERSGFVRVGDILQEAGISHIKMVKKLSAVVGTLQ
jgi:predicted GNAT family N-acyltransferase